ncbi:reverse transcriptase domain-containing protein [Tanacetum coccineum]
MAEKDEEKTAFYTDQGTYCYTKIMFGLKNAGATYHRLVDDAFQSQIGQNLKAYVDDIVVKSKSEREMLTDIAETFDNLIRINMKLNPKKCSFEVEEGKFLGYMVTSEGIRANPAKKGKAMLVHYVSKTLHDAERNYAPLEKMALALRHASRRLRSKAEAFGKLAKYSMDLGAYNITYEPYNAIKRQLLADFINEVPVGSDTMVHWVTPYMIDHQIDCKEKWVLYTDRASNIKGASAGLVLISPMKTEYTYALRLNFDITNNQAEYEALLSGLRIAKKIGVQSLTVNVDSKLVASQINGNYEACKESMIRYLSKAKEYIGCFKKITIRNIPRHHNQKADVLSKLASVAFNHLTKEILVETLDVPLTDNKEISTIVKEEEDNWMTPIVKCLAEGKWPEDLNEARALRMKINQYVMEEGVLFKRSYLMPILRCVGLLQANYVIREIHIGACSMHLKAKSVVAKAIRQRYYWPTMHRDAREEIRKCDSCQIHALIPKLPKTLMTSIMAPWPFFQWGMDVLGLLPQAPGKVKFVIVAVDYFTKWIEAKPLAKTTRKEVNKFVWDNIVFRF